LKTLYFLFPFLFLSSLFKGQQSTSYEKRIFIQDQDTLLYRALLPEGFMGKEQFPLVLFLHGAGERGADNQLQLKLGGELFLDPVYKKSFPAVVLFPQCPDTVMWTHREKIMTEQRGWVFTFPLLSGPPRPAELVNQLVEQWMESGKIDTSRVYIMGLSMGGIGTLEFLYRWPEKYAAAAVICGGHNPELIDSYCEVPIWFFHGGKDDVVPTRYSKAVYEELKNCNPETRYTLYPAANHNSWDAALAEPELLRWLFQFRKKE
jgi:predicted peptidase